MPCSTGDDHCCWIDGEPCRWLREHVGGLRWACQLRLESDSWAGVHADPRYVEIHEYLTGLGLVDCGEYPGPGRTCATCGEAG